MDLSFVNFLVMCFFVFGSLKKKKTKPCKPKRRLDFDYLDRFLPNSIFIFVDCLNKTLIQTTNKGRD